MVRLFEREGDRVPYGRILITRDQESALSASQASKQASEERTYHDRRWSELEDAWASDCYRKVRASHGPKRPEGKPKPKAAQSTAEHDCGLRQARGMSLILGLHAVAILLIQVREARPEEMRKAKFINGTQRGEKGTRPWAKDDMTHGGRSFILAESHRRFHHRAVVQSSYQGCLYHGSTVVG